MYAGFVLTSWKSLTPVSMIPSAPAVNTVSCGSSYRTGSTAFVTTTAHVADALPAVAVMVALPAASAETLPPLMLTMPEGDTLQTSVSVLFPA